MKKKLIFLLTLILALILSTVAFAHPGKTDSNGGHYDKENNEYHYHHGYPAHYHIDGVCPYDFDDKTGENSGNSGYSGDNTDYIYSSPSSTTTTTTTITTTTTQSTTSYEEIREYQEKQKEKEIFGKAYSIFAPIIVLALIAIGIVILYDYIKYLKKKKKLQGYANILKHNLNVLKSQKQHFLHKMAEYTEQEKQFLNSHHEDFKAYLPRYSISDVYKLEELSNFFPNDYCNQLYMFTREDHIIAGVPEQYRFVKDKLYHIRKNDDGNVVSFKPVMVYYSSDPFSYKKCIHLSPKCCYAQIEIPFDNLDKDKVRLCEMCYYKSEHKFLCDFFITSPPHWYTEYMRLYELRKRYDPEYTRILIELLDTPNS